MGISEAAEWWNRAVVCGVGDSRACYALFGGVLRVGTYSRWGRGEEPLRQVAVRLEICSRGKHGKGEKKSGVSGDLTNWYTGVSS